jgi:hypothetical protein
MIATLLGAAVMEESLDRPQWLKEYNEALNKLLNSPEIIEWKTTRALEAAKILSVNQEFQTNIQHLRKKYRIQNGIGKGEILAGVALEQYTSHLDDQDYQQLIKDLQGLAKTFELDWEGEDEGLIVAAVCYGVTPENILSHWESMKLLIAKTRISGVRLFVDSHIRLKEKLIYMTIVSHLCTQLLRCGGKINLPDPLEIVFEALKSVGKIDTKERAEAMLQKIKDVKLAPDLYLKISRNTTIKDVQRTWPQVELRQAEIFGKDTPKKAATRRQWRTYSRDIFIWRRVKLDGLTYEAAYNEWLDAHQEEMPVEISAIIKSVSKIDTLHPDN